ncbi:MAG TPA: hypothetical protein DEH22_14850 [Chloroflexi bacterium]|nr:hypothetical protein [Chloroflexota bacterium]
MKRAHPLLSPFGVIFTLVMLLGLMAIYWQQGGLMFSPGKLSARTRSGVTLQGFASHAEFEGECQRCHAPLQSMQGELCLDCHAAIGDEINFKNGPHENYQMVMRCYACHTDHQGSAFNPTAAAFKHFDHTLASFSLRWHQVDYAADPLKCEDCHSLEGGFATPIEKCLSCHQNYDPNFMTAHAEQFGQACFDCHDGEDRMADFNHDLTTFPLIGDHAGIACADCHRDARFTGIAVECAACHTEPKQHAGLFAEDCSACHGPKNWAAALWNGKPFDHQTESGFSLELHLVDYAGQPIQCQECHFALPGTTHELGFELEECASCHQQAEPIFMAEHQQQFGLDCIACHDGTGRLANFDHNQFFTLDGQHTEIACEDCHSQQVFRGTPRDCIGCHAEPQIHAGLFGLQCESCHTAQAWVPASLTSHNFPLDHGGQGIVACETCHPASYVAYTCYGCHDHQQIEIERGHLEEGISPVELPDCVGCHPNGLKEESEHGGD